MFHVIVLLVLVQDGSEGLVTSRAGRKVARYPGRGGPWLLKRFFGVLSMEVLKIFTNTWDIIEALCSLTNAIADAALVPARALWTCNLIYILLNISMEN